MNETLYALLNEVDLGDLGMSKMAMPLYNQVIAAAFEDELMKIAAMEELEKEALFGLGANAALKAALKGGAGKVMPAAGKTMQQTIKAGLPSGARAATKVRGGLGAGMRARAASGGGVARGALGV